MDLHFYKTLDDSNVINKTLTNQKTISIVARHDFNVLNPDLILVCDVDYSEYNYCHIPELNRFYFVDSFEFINSEMIRLSLSVDVLETYKSDLLNTVCDYRGKAVVGDYGVVDIATTGREIIAKNFSNVELEYADNSILSVLVWG